MPQDIISNLNLIQESSPIYLTGGSVRDILLKKKPNDIDLTIPNQSIEIAREFAKNIQGNFVILDKEEGVARVISPQGIIIDFTNFRENAKEISEDLSHRDFTINAMAIPYPDIKNGFLNLLKGELFDNFPENKIIDPFSGIDDLKKGIIRAVQRENLSKDPLRLLRAYRFMAELKFEINEDTLTEISDKYLLINNSAMERITNELEKIMLSPNAGITLQKMAGSNLLFQIIPELSKMKGVEQPLFHHLDVLEHSLECVRMLDKLCLNPEERFDYANKLKEWIAEKSHFFALKLAALLHDVGKPICKKVEGEKISFYRHDIMGAKISQAIGLRLRLPIKTINLLKSLVLLHMRPFHLINTIKFGGPSKKALRRLLKEIAEHYPGLFLLAMADEMAGCGPLKPKDLFLQISKIWKVTHEFYIENLEILSKKKRLLDGLEIQNILSINPGPVVGKALNAIEEAQILGIISTKEEARDFLVKWYEKYSLSHH